MKKLLIFMLVLGLASVANATLTIVDNFDRTLDIETDVVLTTSDYLYYTLVGDVCEVTISGGNIDPCLVAENGNFWSISIGDDAVGVGYPVVSGMNGIYMTVTLFTGTFASGTRLFEGIDWALVGAPTVPTIYLYRVPEDFSGPGTVDDSIPEPMTIALLGLGGLFLRRRHY